MNTHGNKFKTEILPDLNRNVTKKNQKNEITSKTKYNSFKKTINPSSKLAITDGSNFPKKQSIPKMTLKDIVTASKTSRVFAPKLNRLNNLFTKKKSIDHGTTDYTEKLTSKTKTPNPKNSIIKQEQEEAYLSEQQELLSDTVEEEPFGSLTKMTSKIDKDKKFSEVIGNLDKLKNNKEHSFYKQCLKSLKDIQK